MNQSTFRILDYFNLGLIDFQQAWDLQKKLFTQRIENKINDTLILLEHPHTFTLGKVADKKNLIWNENQLQENEVKVFEIDRGGDITYHGPGQIVGYAILDLKSWYQDTHKYLRALEEVIINVLKDFSIVSARKEGLTGVWIDDRKICAIGIKISRWITMHGFAFNVNTDLNLFNGIIPCGISDKDVTSLEKELGGKQNLNEVKERIVRSFMEVFNYNEVNKKSMRN